MRKFRGQKAWRRLSKQTGSRVGSCGGKEGYATKLEASAVLARMTASPRYRPRPGKVLSVYFCPSCVLFHLGNKPVPVPVVQIRGGGRRKSA